MSDTAHPRIGLALSGGAARGLAHIAVLEALEVEGIPIDAIAGTSAGSIVGALYAAGMPVMEIKRVLLNARWKDVVRFSVPKMGLVNSEGIYRFMEDILPVKKFSSLAIPFAAVATDLEKGERTVLTNGSLARAVQASCSLPIIFTPTEINRRALVDGGVVSQLPVKAAREVLGARKVIAVNVNYRAMESDRLDSLVKIAVHLMTLWASQNSREEEKLADAVISVNTKGFSLYDLSKSRELLRRGRKATEERISAIRELL